MAGLFDSFQRGVAAGKEQRRDRIMGEFGQQALGGDQAALSKVYGVDTNAGMQLQQFAAQQREAQQKAAMGQREEGIRLAKGYLQTRDPGLAQALIPHLKQLHPEMPDNALSLPGADEGIFKAAQALASLGGGAEQFTLSPGSKRFDASGRVLAEVPFAPQRPDFVLSPDGTQWLPKPMGPQQPMGGPQPQQGGDPFASLRAGIPDLRVTSQFRTPEENARLPNSAPNSFHLTGQAIDIGRPSPQQRQQIGAWASQNGYEVIDNYGDGHVHLEPRGRPPQGAPGGAIPIPGATPRRKDPPSGYEWSADGTRQVPIPGGPADRKNNPTPSDQAKGEMAMRKELEDRLKQPTIIMDMYKKVEAAAASPSAPNDLALIFAYMKILDPGSVVREQEFANAQNAASVPDRIRNVYNKALRGERLNDAQRAEFLSSARQVASVAQSQVSNQTRQYQGIADQYGYDAFRSTGAPDFRNVQGNASPQPAQGGILRYNPETGDFD